MSSEYCNTCNRSFPFGENPDGRVHEHFLVFVDDTNFVFANCQICSAQILMDYETEELFWQCDCGEDQ